MIQQLRVLLANRPGALEKLVSSLAAADVNIKALDVSSRGSGEHGEAHLIVDHLQRAQETLSASGQPYEVEEALGVVMEDKVGSMARVLGLFAREQINVRQLYAFVGRVSGQSLAVVSVDDPQRAATVLGEAGVQLVTRQGLEQAAEAAAPPSATLDDHLGVDFIW